MMGNFAKSALQNLTGADSGMSTIDTMTKNNYLSQFIGLAGSSLKSAIESGLVDPNPQPAQPADAPPTPEMIRKQKQAAAADAAQKQMAANPASKVWKSNRAPVGTPASSTPKAAAKTATATSQPAVWKNNRKPYAPATTSPVNETKYEKLNAIFESILTETGTSISTFIQQFFTKQMQGVDISSATAKVKELADKVQADYQKDGGKAALTQLANLGYTLEMVSGTGTSDATQGTTATQTQQAPQTAQQAMSNALGGATPKEKTVYQQVKGMLNKLDNTSKKRILASLQKSLGTTGTPVTPSTKTTPTAGSNAFAQMGQQLTQPGATNTASTTPAAKSSTGGKIQQTGAGQVHTKSRKNPNIKRRAKKATEVPQQKPQWTGVPKKEKASVTNEGKRVVKVWGQK